MSENAAEPRRRDGSFAIALSARARFRRPSIRIARAPCRSEVRTGAGRNEKGGARPALRVFAKGIRDS
jgi:hypothetical protein